MRVQAEHRHDDDAEEDDVRGGRVGGREMEDDKVEDKDDKEMEDVLEVLLHPRPNYLPPRVPDGSEAPESYGVPNAPNNRCQ